MLSFIFKMKKNYVYKFYDSVVDRSFFRLQTMIFRINLLFVYISLCISLQYDANARTVEWPKVINVWFLSHLHFLFFQQVTPNFDNCHFTNWTSTIFYLISKGTLTINATIVVWFVIRRGYVCCLVITHEGIINQKLTVIQQRSKCIGR